MDKHDDKTRIQKHSLLVTDYEKTQVLINYQAKSKISWIQCFQNSRNQVYIMIAVWWSKQEAEPFSTTEKLKNNQYSQKQQNSKDVTIN